MLQLWLSVFLGLFPLIHTANRVLFPPPAQRHNPLTSLIKYDVKRFPLRRDGLEPYIPVNYILNDKNYCYGRYCWQGNAKCIGYSCCVCQCKNGGTYLSRYHGCKQADQIRLPGHISLNKNEIIPDEQCKFATKKIGFTYVPLFSNSKNFKNIEIYSTNKFMNGTECQAGPVYVYDYHGHQLLYHWNECNEMFRVSTNDGKYFLKWTSENYSHWKLLRGNLVSLRITCRKNDSLNHVKISSCLLFQVEGTYSKDAGFKKPNAIVSKHACSSSTGYSSHGNGSIIATAFRDSVSRIPLNVVAGLLAGITSFSICFFFGVLLLLIMHRNRKFTEKEYAAFSKETLLQRDEIKVHSDESLYSKTHTEPHYEKVWSRHKLDKYLHHSDGENFIYDDVSQCTRKSTRWQREQETQLNDLHVSERRYEFINPRKTVSV